MNEKIAWLIEKNNGVRIRPGTWLTLFAVWWVSMLVITLFTVVSLDEWQTWKNIFYDTWLTTLLINIESSLLLFGGLLYLVFTIIGGTRWGPARWDFFASPFNADYNGTFLKLWLWIKVPVFWLGSLMIIINTTVIGINLYPGINNPGFDLNIIYQSMSVIGVLMGIAVLYWIGWMILTIFEVHEFKKTKNAEVQQWQQ